MLVLPSDSDVRRDRWLVFISKFDPGQNAITDSQSVLDGQNQVEFKSIALHDQALRDLIGKRPQFRISPVGVSALRFDAAGSHLDGCMI